MSKESYIGGDYIETTGGSTKIYAAEDIENSSAMYFAQTGSDDGVLYGMNEDPPIIDPTKEIVFLYLLFYVSEEHKGKLMISEASQTRLQNIKKTPGYDGKKYKAFSIPIQSIDEILEQIPKIIEKHSEGNKKRVIVTEIGVFSHAGGDGPISYNKEIKNCPIAGWPHQMDICGWEQIEVEWSANPKFVFYGCNTGNNSGTFKNFVESISNLSNFKDVEVWGQSTSSFPSFYPDFRVTTIARSVGENGTGWNVGPTYQVAGDSGQGSKAITYTGFEKTVEELKKFPKANNLNVYKNGTLVKSSHQGIFNDDR